MARPTPKPKAADLALTQQACKGLPLPRMKEVDELESSSHHLNLLTRASKSTASSSTLSGR